MPQAARLGDRITHTNAYAGLIAGALAGAAIAAICVTTGGVGAIALAAAGGAGLGGVIGEFAGGFATSDTGSITGGSGDVFTNMKRAARATDQVGCSWHGTQKIAEGSATVAIDGLPAARVGDRTTCGAQIATGSGNTVIGGPTKQVLKVDPEVPLIAELLVAGLGLVTGVGAVALAADGMKLLMGARLAAGLAGGLGAGYAGSRVGGALWGEGSRGQRQLALGSGLLGGALASGALGGKLDPFNMRAAEPEVPGAAGTASKQGPSAYPFDREPPLPPGGKEVVVDFQPKRPGGLDMENLSPADKEAANAMARGGWDSRMQDQVLNSGDDFGVRQGQQGEPLYKVSSLGRDEAAADPSAYYTDQAGYDDLQSRYYDEAADSWDSKGIKNGIALPCYNDANAIWQGNLNSDQPLVTSTTNPVTETVRQINPDGSVSSTFDRYMQGGGSQVTPARDGVGGLVPHSPKGKP